MWLFALATNLYRSELRRIPANIVSLADTAEPRTSGGTGMEEEEQNRAVKHAVLALPPKYREALILFYFQEKDVPSGRTKPGHS